MATSEIARNVTDTASAANEMSDRTVEVSAEAKQTGMHAAEVRETAAGLNVAMGELRHSVIRVVRTSTPEVDRRVAKRSQVDLPCRVSVPGQAAFTARVRDISEGGANVRGGSSLPPGAHVTLNIDGFGFALPGIVRSSEGDTLHLIFELDAGTADKFKPALEQLTLGRAA